MSAPLHAELEARARALDEPGVAVIATTGDGAVVYWSDGARSLYGWSRDEALGKDVVELTPTELSRREAGDILRALKEGRKWSGSFLVRTKTGARFVAEVEDLPVLDESGSLVGILGVSRRAAYLGR